jgi:hypothetical protein
MNRLALHRVLGLCLMDPARAQHAVADPSFPWALLIEAANRTYLTPALDAALRGGRIDVPGEVADYLAMIAERNRTRNRRLRSQLRELVGALNRVGIAPLLLKGAAGLFDSPDDYASTRIVTDLDLLVGAGRITDACAVLESLGYRRLEGRAPGAHAAGDFIRDIDVGAVDLHVHLLNEPQLLPVADVLERSVLTESGGLQARCLAPTDRVLHLLLHDLVQDQGLHDGRLNIRHLHEIAILAAAGSPVCWDEIVARLALRRLDPALGSALLAAHALFGMTLPSAVRPSPAARVMAWRALLQLRYPRLERWGEIFGNAHRSLAWYRHADANRRFPRLRRAADYLRVHHIRTAGRVLHVLFARRT